MLLSERIEEQARQRPDALAVVAEHASLTYGVLNQRANQLAHYLQQLGVGPEVPVGLCLNRSVEVFIGLSGILKAGGVYVPLDPSYPSGRIAFMLDDAQIRFLITSDDLKARFKRPGMHQLCLSDPALEEQLATNLSCEVAPDTLAYIIYTSGSTGNPKGVQVTHRGLCNLINWHLKNFDISSQDRASQVASLSFDAAGWEIWPYLVAGATVCLVPDEVRSQPTQLLDWLLTEQVTVSFLPTPLAEELLDVAWPTTAALRLLLTGGDRLRRRPPAALPCPLINNYGPSEYSVVATSGLVTPAEDAIDMPSIGCPIANTRTYVLDQDLHPVTAGMEGELSLGGEGLARGYLRHPALTAERFVPDPFSSQPGARLYRTGDLVYAGSDEVSSAPGGAYLHFRGRTDEQVKIRGMRVELGEIEAVLQQIPDVREAVVLLLENVAAGPKLVAYLVPRPDSVPTLNQIRQHLQAQLPDHMLPSAFVLLERLPMTPNGKVDRKALPGPEDGCTGMDEPRILPRTPVEELLAEIWSELLDLAQIGIQDSFFSLGGHSLLATRAVSQIRERLQVDLSLRTLFDFPTIEQLATHIGQLSTRRELNPPTHMRVAEPTQDISLSFAQQRLWFLDQLEPGNPFYNATIAIHFEGKLLVNVLARCLNEILLRHEVLRTSFAAVGGKPVQVVSPPSPLPLPLIDLSNLPLEEKKRAAFRQIAVEEGQRPFDLGKSPLLRVTLLRQSVQQHLLLLSMHHIVSDDWSMEVFFRELAALYEAFAENRPSPLSALPIQYADYALWQRRWLQGERLEQQLRYWQRQLTDLPLLQLPTDRPHPVVQTYRGATCSFVVSPEVTQGLRNIGRQTDTTLFMALLAAFEALLYRYTGQQDIAIGSPIANRMRGETRDLIGFFVNTLVFRATLSSTMTFHTLLAHVRRTALEAYAHQDIPFEKLVEELQPERNLMRQPLFQAAFALLNDPLLTLKIADVTLGLLDVDNGTAKFDLTLFVHDERELLTGLLEYNADIFDRATIERMTGHFCTLLQSISDYPKLSIAELPLLTTVEREQILFTWNETEVPYPAGCCVHELFEEQVLRSPDAVAVEYDEAQLTYDTLNKRANQLAHLLQRLHAGPEVPVGICLERSPELIIALVGVLKAGTAYMPLDLAYPKERLAFLLQDAHVSIVLAQQKLREQLPVYQAKTVCLDSDWDDIEREEDCNLCSDTTGGNGARATGLAYIIYTSGSTGQPKGVSVAHRAINRLVCNADFVQLRADDRVAQASNTSFDAATFEIWGALLNGGRLVGVAKETVLDAHAFARFLRQQQITTLFVTTALFNQGVREVPHIFQPLRHLLFGGEAVDPRWVREALVQGTPQRLLHVYGPTENTTFSSWHVVSEVSEKVTTIPIGRPIANTQLYVLDQHLRPVPVGIKGELYIGGEGLARDYLGHPVLTARKFVPHPFSTQAGARLYRTGDLVRQLVDGSIEFLGRVDHQIKLRGYRVELGEIEATMSQHSSVQEAVVTVREDIPGDKRLVAYVVPSSLEAEIQSSPEGEEHVATWQELFEETYRSSEEESDLDFNIVGWNSSYTGLPLPREHMQEWLEHTLVRIRTEQPQRVLEIGCGTGLLLLRLAPECVKYWGTDFSTQALRMVQNQIEQRNLSQVQLLQRMADDFAGMEEQTFDTVILNSIVQYFPGVDYLLRVLEGAMQRVGAEGSIFLGDIRNQLLLEAFHVSVELYRADGAMSCDQFQQRVRTQMAQEAELLIDPAFFYALQQRYPQIRQVCIHPKRGHYDNELTAFRYDVELRIGGEQPNTTTINWEDWQQRGFSLPALQQMLVEQRPSLLALTAIPNRRLSEAHKMIRLLQTQELRPVTVKEARAILVDSEQVPTCTPEDIYSLGEQLGYSVDVRWSGREAEGNFDAVFYLPSARQELQQIDWPQPSQTKEWNKYANQPLRETLKSGSQLILQLKHFLQERLADYMIPSFFVLLDALPLNANGKVDRHALPTPEQERPMQTVAYLAPRTLVEQMLAEIWVEVLGIEQVGVRDNFFEIGGHSLLATQVISRVNDTFQITMPLRTLFETPTVEYLASALTQYAAIPGQIEKITHLYSRLNALSAHEIHTLLQNKKRGSGE